MCDIRMTSNHLSSRNAKELNREYDGCMKSATHLIEQSIIKCISGCEVPPQHLEGKYYLIIYDYIYIII